MTDKQIIEKTKNWLWELTEPNEKFGGFGICPFLKKELTNDDIKFIILRGQGFKSGLDNWIKENKYNLTIFDIFEFWNGVLDYFVTLNIQVGKTTFYTKTCCN